MEETPLNQQAIQPPGILITKGLRLAIPAGGLRLSMREDGTTESSLELHTAFDVCHIWLELALRHLSIAESCRQKVDAAWSTQNQATLPALLEDEFLAGMQAIVAAAIAMDALYGVVKEVHPVPPDLLERWREKRTSRSSQISETLRRAFALKPPVANAVKKHLHEIIVLRDRAVHPDAKCAATVLHPEFNVGVDWKFVAYRVQNAKNGVQFAVSLAAQLMASTPKSPALRERCVQYLPLLLPALDETERRYGELFPRAASVADQFEKARASLRCAD